MTVAFPKALGFLGKGAKAVFPIYKNFKLLTQRAYRWSELAGLQTIIFEDRILFLVRFHLLNQSMYKILYTFVVDLWERLLKKAHFTLKAIDPASPDKRQAVFQENMVNNYE